VRVPAGASWLLLTAACPVQQTPLFCHCLVQCLSRGVGSAPRKRDGAGGGCACLTPPRSQRCRRAHPGPWDLSEFPIPGCFREWSCSPLCIHLCLLLWDKIPGQSQTESCCTCRVGWPLSCLRLWKCRVKLVVGCLATSPLARLCKLFENGTETLLHPFSLRPPTTSPALGDSI